MSLITCSVSPNKLSILCTLRLNKLKNNCAVVAGEDSIFSRKKTTRSLTPALSVVNERMQLCTLFQHYFSMHYLSNHLVALPPEQSALQYTPTTFNKERGCFVSVSAFRAVIATSHRLNRACCENASSVRLSRRWRYFVPHEMLSFHWITLFFLSCTHQQKERKNPRGQRQLCFSRASIVDTSVREASST